MEKIEAPMIHTVPQEELDRLEDEAIEDLNADAWKLVREENIRRNMAATAVRKFL